LQKLADMFHMEFYPLMERKAVYAAAIGIAGKA
jgi:hypothetical protein